MSPPRVAHVPSRFATRARQGRGVGVAEAVAAADAAIGEMRGAAVREIERLLGEAQRLAADLDAAGNRAALHRAVDAVVGLVGVFGPAELGAAAVSLRERMDAVGAPGPSPRVVRVHLDAMHLFWTASPEERAAAAPEVLAALRGLGAPAPRGPVAANDTGPA